jgi:hypothetical protein
MRGTTKMLCAAVSLPLFLSCGCGDDDAPAVLPPVFVLSGDWETFVTPLGGSEQGPMTCVIVQTGNSLFVYDDTGTDLVGSGTISGNSVEITLQIDTDVYVTLTGTADTADHLEGTFVASDETGTWRCERV